MAVNRYTNLTPSDFNPLSLQEQMMVPLAKQKKHDAMLEQIVKSGAFDVNRLKVDDELVNQNITSLKDRLANIENDLLERGVSSGLSKKLLQLKRDRDMFLSNEGIGGKAQNAYDAYNQNVKDIRGNRYIKPQDADKFIAYGLKRYNDSKGVAAGQTYNPYSGAASVEVNGRARQMASQMKTKDVTKILREQGIIRTTEELSQQDIEQAVLYNLMADNDVMAYVNALSDSTGEDHMSLLRNAARGSGLIFKQNNVSDKPLGTTGRNSSRTTTKTEKESPANIYALEGATEIVKENFGTFEELNKKIKEGDELIKNGKEPSEFYHQAKDIKKRITHDFFNSQQGQKYSDVLKSKLPPSLQNDDIISDFYDPLANEAYSFNKIYENEDGNHALVTDGDGDIMYYELSDLGMQELSKYDKMPAGTKFSKLQDMYKRKDSDMFFKQNSSNGKPLGVKGLIKKDDVGSFTEFYDSYGQNTTKFKLEGLSPTQRKVFTDDVFSNIEAGGLNNYDFINVTKAVGSKDKNHKISASTALNMLKRGNITDKKVLYAGESGLHGLPTITISFRGKAKDGVYEDSDFYQMTVLADKINHRGNHKSGEISLFAPYERYGGAKGKMLVERMKDKIRFKNIRTNYRMDDFDNSSQIKQAISPDIFRKKNIISQSDKLNIFRTNDNKHTLIIGKEDGKNIPLTWDKVIKPENLDKGDYVIPNRLVAAMISNMKLIDPEFSENELFIEHNGKIRVDPSKVKSLAKNLQSFSDNVVKTNNTVDLLRIINSID